VSSPPTRILIVDGTNTLYRAFFAIPPLRAPDGTPTNAIYGFTGTLQKLIREERPDCVVAVFDARGGTFRDELYPAYKATREAQPEDLSAQIPWVREIVEASAIPILEIPGYEADDVIATLVARAPPGAEVAIVSTDKDLMQLVSERVTLLDGVKERRYDPAAVEARFGVPPGRVLDLRALVGDPSDNIPGVKGIGEKGAAKLLAEWGSLEALLEHRGEIPQKKTREALEAGAADARLSKRLATLACDVPLPLDWDAMRRREPDRARLRALYERLGMGRLLAGLGEEGGAAPPAPEGGPAGGIAPEIAAEPAALRAAVEEALALPVVPLLAVMEGEGSLEAEAAGLALGLPHGRVAFAPLARGGAQGLAVGEALEALSPLLGEPAPVAWVGADTKRLQVWLAERGLEPALPHFDVELAGQLLDPSAASGVPALAARRLGRKVASLAELAGRGTRARRAAELAPGELARLAAEQLAAVRDLQAPLARELEEAGLARLYHELELPLTRVLAGMERAGVRVDEARLASLSREYEAQLAEILGRIHALAGAHFNVASPKQLQRVLFEELKLPVVKKTKTGYSTDEDVLEQLASQHELPALILAHRRLAKLKSTYVDALPPLVNPRTGRIHPTFHQLGAATGRISSSNPNVQNIPIRSEEGARIREAFVPAEGSLLLSADYSQVELRILAHYSGDESLIAAFQRGEDIHRRTAAEVAGIAPERVDAALRARAKAVNFGIVYGSSAFGLARQLGIASGEAQETIDAYFARYRGVRRFLDETVARAREQGFVRTLLGRRRALPDLASRNRALRNAAERMAVNTVIQGTAADLIKKAMLEVDAALREAGLGARMILQVHDELVFEAPQAEVEATRERVRERMQEVFPLRVPLLVEVGVGRSWREAH
jgi:DNA polymerase-1